MPHRPPHPAKAIIIGRGEQINEAAAAVGVNRGTFGRVLNKKAEPWPALRHRLAEHLGLPESELFDDDRSDIARIVAESRAAQGLPPKVTDPAVIARVASLIAASDQAGAGLKRAS